MSEEIREGVDGTLEQGDFKLKTPAKKTKTKPKKLTTKKTNEVVKVDLTKKKENAVQESSTKESVLRENETSEEKRDETEVGLQEVGSTHEEKETTEKIEKEVDSPIVEINAQEDKKIEPLVEKDPLPENVEKLVNFMKETGGTIEDYMKLNVDYSEYSNSDILREYYSKTKPHLDKEEIDFLLEDNFSFDEENDEEREVRKKKLAYKEEIVKAKSYLEDAKNKYYDEIKLRPGVTQEQQKAVDFFNRYNEQQEAAKKRHEIFSNNTKKFFTNEFEGFDFNVGEKRFRYKVGDTNVVANNQASLNNFVEKFFDKNGEIKSYNDYHKAIYAAENADTIANHFYEQGKADALKDVMAKSKNVSNAPRETSTGDVFINGLKVKAISGVDSSQLKVRINKK
tara:strand:+ start:3544 stop:4734 length:1191 start_codon:yes stop_codon:yes gene_type:complete